MLFNLINVGQLDENRATKGAHPVHKGVKTVLKWGTYRVKIMLKASKMGRRTMSQ